MEMTTGFTPAEGALISTFAGPVGRANPSALSVEVARTQAQLEKLGPEWLALERLSGANVVFQTHAQIRTWARHFCGTSRRGRLHVAVVREAGRAVLILPLAASGPPRLRIARIAGDPISQYSDLLLDPAVDGQAAFKAALASASAAGINAIVMRRVRADSQLMRLAGDRLRPATTENVAPFADLSAFPDYDAFLRSLSKKMRQGLRNRRNHLDKAGEVSFEVIAGGPEARLALADAIGLKRQWLVQRGAMSTAFLDPSTKDCLLDLAGDGAGSGSVVFRLLVNGEPAAIRFAFEQGGTHFSYMSAYDASFSHLSPGKMLMEFCIAGAQERGIARIDMLPPDGQHKRDWCYNEMAVADYTLPLTAAGRAYAEVYQKRARPALKSVWNRLPDRVRSAIATVLVTI